MTKPLPTVSAPWLELIRQVGLEARTLVQVVDTRTEAQRLRSIFYAARRTLAAQKNEMAEFAMGIRCRIDADTDACKWRITFEPVESSWDSHLIANLVGMPNEEGT